MSWDTSKGFYISPIVLDADWDQEVKNIETVIGEHNRPLCLEGRAFDEKITWLSFKSKDGKETTKPAIKENGVIKGELPEDYIWTPAYYNNPVLKKLIDWFPVEKTRVRLARENPNAFLEPHFDWDNLAHGFDDNKQIVRIWVQLDDAECWYRLTNGIDDVSFTLKRGQFIVLNVDTVIHSTENLSKTPRSNLIIHAKVNFWIRSLPDLFRRHRVINPVTDEPQ